MKLATLALTFALASSLVFADDLKGKTEISAFGGVNRMNNFATLTSQGGSSNHPLWGISAGYGVTSHTQLFGEFDQTRFGGSRQILDYLGGVKYSFTKGERISPYGLLGVGAGTFRHFGEGTVIFGSGPNDYFALLWDASPTHLALHAGGGVRLYVGRRWGGLSELRWSRYFSSVADANAFRATGGLFFQW